MSANIKVTDDLPGQPPPRREPIIVELGDHSRKQIRKLRKGRGKLYDAMSEVLSELEQTGSVKGPVQPVVIVVKERSGWDNTAWPGYW